MTPGLESTVLSKFDCEKDTQCFQLEPWWFLSMRHYVVDKKRLIDEAEQSGLSAQGRAPQLALVIGHSMLT